MYSLHYAPDNASLILRLVMLDAGLPFTTQLVNRATRQQDSAAYRALNPTGLIPTLVTPAGPISETAACLLWLAEAHPSAGLAPPPGHAARIPFLKWLFFLSNTAHADLRQIFYPDQYVGQEGRTSHLAKLTTRMTQHFTLLNQAALTHPNLFAAPCVLAYYTSTLMRWPMLYPKTAQRWFKITDFPALHAMAKTIDARPATLAAASAEGLGPTPFTHPPCARPPEGSAV